MSLRALRAQIPTKDLTKLLFLQLGLGGRLENRVFLAELVRMVSEERRSKTEWQQHRSVQHKIE